MELEDLKKAGVEFVSMQFVDILGNIKSCETTLQHFEEVNEAGGLWFDGSSIQGFTRIFESDMFLKPDGPFTLLPWANNRIARVPCNVFNRDKTPFEGDPRNILKRNIEAAEKMGFKYYVGPELEFFLFKDTNGATVQPDPHDKAGYFDWSPLDEGSEVKREVMLTLQQMGVPMERLSHEVAHGQHEIGFKYDQALEMADRVLLIKNVVKIIAKKHGLYASFMPKPLVGKNGSGMHVHQSLWKGGENAFYGEGREYNLSDTARQFIAGQMKHARAFAGIIAPTVNSYKRLVPGFEAPVYVCWGRVNRSAMIRVPEVHGKKATRVELRCPDASTNPYLAFSAMLASGLEGISGNLEPPAAVEESVYDFDDAKLEKFYVQTLPANLGEAMGETRKSELMRKTLGEHAFAKHLTAQERQWNDYRLSVSDWEIKTYLPKL